MNKLRIAIEFYHRKNLFHLRCVASSLMIMIALHDLTALDGAAVLALPAVEVGEQADHPHVVNLGVALPLIVLFALHGSDCSELSKEQEGEISDLVLPIA